MVNAIIRWCLRNTFLVLVAVAAILGAGWYALTNTPVYVVRNVPEARFGEGPGRPDLVAHLKDGNKHLVFLGALQKEKGARYMLQLLEYLPADFVLDCFSGRTDKNAFFSEAAARRKVSARVHIHELVPQAELCATIRHAFAGISVFVPSSRIYQYALPNKLFEYFLAGLPVITSNARAQAELVSETGLGLVVDLADPEGSAKRIAAWTPPAVTRDVVERHGLTWEQEERELARVYRDLGIL